MRHPAYNEEATLSEIVVRLLAVPEAGEIVIVDDCSTDGTRAIADREKNAVESASSGLIHSREEK